MVGLQNFRIGSKNQLGILILLKNILGFMAFILGGGTPHNGMGGPCGVLVPRRGMEAAPPAVEVWSPP